MKLDIDPDVLLDALAEHITQQALRITHLRDERRDADQRAIDAEEKLHQLEQQHAAAVDVVANLQLGALATVGCLDRLPDGSIVIDQHGVAWQRWPFEAAASERRWWAHSPNLATAAGGGRSEGSGRWSSTALLAQRGPVRVIYVPEGGQV
ncbi:hypothetical protein [Nocardia sp. MW-W600-9]